MDSPKFYNNPAFCQQSEFYSHHQTRQSPIGARKLSFTHHSENPQISGEVEEQEFYEEVIVDNNGFIKGKKFVVVTQNHEGQKYIQVPQRRTPQKERYEYIPMREKERKISQSEEIVEVAPGIMHRYAVIDPSSNNDPELSPNREKYALVPVSDLKRVVSPQNQRKLPQNSPPNWIELPHTPIKSCTPLNSRSTTPNYSSSKFRSGTNHLATQKLHELLSTPKNTHHHQTPPNISISPIRSGNNFATMGRNRGFSAPSKVQQKLTTRYEAEQNRVEALEREKFKMQQHFARTAIVQPNSFIDSRKNYPSDGQKSLDTSWISQNGKLPFESGKALAAAAFITFLCGIGTTGLCFYMLSFMGRPYYLDFSTVAGFTCSLLGILGCRSRHVYWIPNRNYLSGYLVLSLFSVSTCVGLIILLVNKPLPGTPLADMTSAAICGFSVLILLLSLTGVVSSYCCKYPPPDNRVQHCSPGLTV